MSDGFSLILRADGRVEVACRHGVGHPSWELQRLRTGRDPGHCDMIHGCDRCCQTREWKAAEAKFIQEALRRRKP